MKESEFVDLPSALQNKQIIHSGTKADIIKGSQVRSSNKKRLIGEPQPAEPGVEPIRDDTGDIIGIKVYCTCGKATHVYFEFQ